MTGRMPLAALGSNMTPERRARAAQKAAAMIEDMALAELRRARSLSQQQLATVLHVNQASVAKLEKRADMYLSTLRSYIEAMGGELELTARFADRTVPIRSFEAIDKREPELA